MKDSLILCLRCGGDAAYQTYHGTVKACSCLGCGFSTMSTLEEGSEYQKKYEESLPELYKDLKFIDIENKAWYPSTINNEKMGMIFLDGTSKNSYFWTAMKVTEVKDEEKDKFKKPGIEGEYFTHKVDISTKKSFGQKGFMDAMEYVGLFNVNQTEYGI